MKKRSFKQKVRFQKYVYDGLKLKEKNLGGIALLLFVFLFSAASAQEAINSSGGDGSGTGGSVAYSVGSVVYTTNNGTSGSVAQGVQHPYEIFVITGISDEKGIDLVSAYPNPVSDYLILKVESDKIKGSNYQLYNLEGRLLESKELINSETHISMETLKAATYLLKIMNNNKEIKTFKIIKN